MGEVKVTYETLFDLLRREKSRNELQALDASFYEDVVSYLSEKSSLLGKESFSPGEKEKVSIQIRNARKILKELYELREKKVLLLALNKVRTGSKLISTAQMLGVERALFDDAIVLLSKYKEGVLDKVSSGVLPSIHAEKEVVKETQSALKEDVKEEPEEKSAPSSSSRKVKFLCDLPKFVGLDKSIYGPYKKEEVASLPANVAELLARKGRVEVVES